jgi:nitric oxide reductase large subunit
MVLARMQFDANRSHRGSARREPCRPPALPHIGDGDGHVQVVAMKTFPRNRSPSTHTGAFVLVLTTFLFTTTLVFSPADTVPLTRRAKVLMLLQALISAATIVVIAGSAINNL